MKPLIGNSKTINRKNDRKSLGPLGSARGAIAIVLNTCRGYIT